MELKELSVAALRFGLASYHFKDTFPTLPTAKQAEFLGIDQDRLYQAHAELEASGYLIAERKRGTRTKITLLDQYGNPVLFGRVEQGIVSHQERDIHIIKSIYRIPSVSRGGDVESDQVSSRSNGCALPLTSSIQTEPTPLDTSSTEEGIPHPVGYVPPPSSRVTSEPTLSSGVPYPVGDVVLSGVSTELPTLSSGGCHSTEAADDMDDEGVVDGRGKSPADIRRKAQVESLMVTFIEEFPEEAEYPLTKKMATDWLNMVGGSAAEVRSQIRELKRFKERRGELISSPKQYITNSLKRAKRSEQNQTVSQPAKDLSNEFAGKVQPGEQRQPTLDDPYVQRLLARRAAAGLSTQIEIGGRV